MAINLNLPNPYQLPIVESPYKDMLANALSSFTGVQNARHLPGQLQRKEQEELLKNEKEQLANALEKKFGQRREEANIGLTEANRGHREFENAIRERFGVDQEQAKLLADQWLSREREQKYRHGEEMHPIEMAAKQHQIQYGHLTPDQKIMADLYGYGSPQYHEQLSRSQGIYGRPKDESGQEIPLPKGSINIQGMPANEQNYFSKQMSENVTRAEAAKKVNRAGSELLEIIDRNPKLNRELQYIMTHPDDAGFIARTLRGVDPKVQTDIDLFQKNAALMALYQSETGNTRSTNLYRNMVMQTKPSAGMTAQANRKILHQIMSDNDPLIKYAEEAAPFIGSYYIPYQEQNYRNSEEERKTNNGYKGTNYSKSQIQQAAKEEGKTEEEVIDELRSLGA